MRIITVEEHTISPALNKALAKYGRGGAPYQEMAHAKGYPYDADPVLFADMGEKRIADMDVAGIAMQVVSCPVQPQQLPPEIAVSAVREANDELADAIRKHPDRFAGFCALPWPDPEAAAKELERAAKLGYRGVLIGGRAIVEGGFLDDPRFTPVLEAAEALDMPIYVHPGAPMDAVQKAYYAGLDDLVSARLSLFGWGWHHEAGIQVLRMILSGVFDRFPKLQVISGHWGEMVPFFLSRLDQALPQKATHLERTITETYRQHVYVTPSGIFDEPQLKFCAEVLGADRIIHSVDFPFIENQGARSFLENASIGAADKELIAHGNAERLLRL